MTTILEMPANLIDHAVRNDFKLQFIQQTTRNLGTDFVRESAPSDVRWAFSMNSGTVSARVWDEFETFHDKVKSVGGFFTAYDPAKPYPCGTPLETFCEDTFSDGTTFSDGYGFADNDGLPQIDGYFNAGDDIIYAKNFKEQSRVLCEGDHIELRHGIHDNIPFLYKAKTDAYSNAAGEAAIELVNPLRQAVRLGDDLRFIRCRSVFQFRNFNSDRQSGHRGTISVEAVETPEVLLFPSITIAKG